MNAAAIGANVSAAHKEIVSKAGRSAINVGLASLSRIGVVVTGHGVIFRRAASGAPTRIVPRWSLCRNWMCSSAPMSMASIHLHAKSR